MMLLRAVKCIGLVLLNAACLLSLQTDDVSLVCPANWTEGATQIITCFVNASKYSRSTCTTFTDLVEFKFLAAGGSTASTECSVENLTQACNTGMFLPKGCRCKEVRDGRYVLEFFVTSRRERYEGGRWQCVPACFDEKLRNPFLSSSSAAALQCGPVEFGVESPSTQTSPTPTDTGSLSPATSGQPSMGPPTKGSSQASIGANIKPSMTRLPSLIMITQVLYVTFLW